MAVNITRPAIDIREKLTELDRPVGIAGKAMLAADTSQEQFSLIGAGRKNLFINGDFRISQRGDFTSTASVSDDNFRMDRWQIRISGALAQMRQNTAVLPNGDNTYSYYVVANSTNSVAYHNIRQIIEDYKALSGKTITLSCWAKGSGAPLYFRHWSTGNIGDPMYLTDQWQYFTRTYKCPTITAAGEGANQTSFGIGTYPGTGSGTPVYDGDHWEVANFQLEIGSTATPFEYRTIAEELAACQRYYQTHDVLGAGVWNSASSFFCATDLTVPMREVPAMTTKSGTNSNINIEDSDLYDITGFSPAHTTVAGRTATWEISKIIVNFTVSNSRTQGNAGVPCCDQNDDYFILDAEL